MTGEISLGRIKVFTIFIGLAGAMAVLLLRGTTDALGFLLGAVISLISLRSWIRVSDGIGAGFKPSVAASAIFLSMRYVLIAALIYAIVRVLGITPLAMIVGLLASFAAVILELLYQFVTPGK
jgi:hypothetical protein